MLLLEREALFLLLRVAACLDEGSFRDTELSQVRINNSNKGATILKLIVRQILEKNNRQD